MPGLGLAQISDFTAVTADHPIYPVAKYPFSQNNGFGGYAVGDLNADGKPDLAAAHSGDLRILLNNGYGGFSPPIDIVTSSITSVALGDMDGDDDLDVVLAHGTFTPPSIVFNEGDGQFSNPAPTAMVGAELLLVEQLDEASLADIATSDGDRVRVYTNDGDATFTLSDSILLNSITQMRAFMSSPFSGIDLYVLWNGNLSVLQNDGSAEFSIVTITPVADDIDAFAIGSLNDASGPDLVLTTSGPDLLWTAFNDGTGMFGNTQSYPLDARAPAVELANMDGSGPSLDVVVGQGNDRTIKVLLNNESGQLGNSSDYRVPRNIVGLVVEDLNGDHAPDVLVNHGAAAVLMNADDGNGRLFEPGYTPTVGERTGIVAADFDVDGYPDVAISAYGPVHEGVGLFFNNRDGTLGAQTNTVLTGRVTDIVADDFNGDDAPDLAVINRSPLPNKMIVLLNDGEGSFGPGISYDVGSSSTVDYTTGITPTPALGDFNGDGAIDVAVTNFRDDSISIMHNNNGAFAEIEIPVFNRPTYIAAARLNADAYPDIAVTTADLPGEIQLYLNVPDFPGAVFTAGQTITLSDFAPSGLLAADLNGDGRSDLVTTNFFEDVARVLIAGPDGSFNGYDEYAVGEEPRHPAVADANGDGWPDLFVVNGGNANHDVGLLLNQGDGTFAPQVTYHTDLVRGLAIANFDRDELGAPDVVVYGEVDGEDMLSVLPNVRGVELDEAVFCSHSPLLVQPGDDVTITTRVQRIVDGEISPEAGKPAMLEIWVDDGSEPVESVPLANSTTYVIENAAAGSFTYGCRVTDGPVQVFSGWSRVAVGPAPNSRAIPVRYTGTRSERIDIVFFADSDNFSGFEDPAFLEDVTEFIEDEYWNRLWFLQHQDWFNFWIAPDMADAFRESDEDKGIVKPDNWKEDYGFAEVRAVLHSDPFRDFANSSGITIESDEIGVFGHETGHRAFGLADEYPPDGGYYESRAPSSSDPLFPNLHETLERCERDAPLLNRPASACYSFMSEDDEEWFKSDPDSDDLMRDSGRPQAADLRRMNWLIDRCREGDC